MVILHLLSCTSCGSGSIKTDTVWKCEYFILNKSIYHSKKFIIILTMISFSSGFDSAKSKVIATKVLSEIIFWLALNSKLFLFKKYRNILAAIRLHPSVKG